ncbi:MAG: hypothetical protein OEV49_03555 [candidate division Zixibacteria bacterium]|nr:hypothetical protein [candidate division Zixibacteria bacterium]MDH3937837.1 hypothetical protein [candidate division Zixibacteria bacterium]MDH4034926.1 hypothetical protein [candidate division Zixibacteria bacterium]
MSKKRRAVSCAAALELLSGDTQAVAENLASFSQDRYDRAKAVLEQVVQASDHGN